MRSLAVALLLPIIAAARWEDPREFLNKDVLAARQESLTQASDGDASTTTHVSSRSTPMSKTRMSEEPTPVVIGDQTILGDAQECFYHQERLLEKDCLFWICGKTRERYIHSFDPSDKPGQDSFFFEVLDRYLPYGDWAEGEVGMEESFALTWEWSSHQCKCSVGEQEIEGKVRYWSEGDGGFTHDVKLGFCRCSFECHPDPVII